MDEPAARPLRRPPPRRPWFRGGLRLQILTRLLLLLAVLFLLVSVVVLQLTQRSLVSEARRGAETLAVVAATLSGAAVDPAWELREPVNAENLQRVVELFAQSFGAEHVEIADEAFRVVASAPAPPTFEAASPSEDAHRQARAADAAVWTGAPGLRRTEITLPIRDDRGELRGSVHVAVGLERIEKRIRDTQRLMLLYLLLDLLVIFVVGYIELTRVVVRPLARVSAATAWVEGAEAPTRVEVPGDNEVGDLARNFNAMVAQIHAGRAAVEAKIDELGQANAALQQTRDELVRSEKLATVGQISAGIAHEIGNPLSAVIGLVDVLEMMACDGDLREDEARDLAARIRRELGRIDGTIRELLRFAHDEDEQVHALRVEEPVRHALALAAHHPRSRGIDVEVELPDDLPWVLATESALVQVLLNLLLNAADAMGGRGRVRVTGHTKAGDATRLCLAVEDEGPGIPEADRARVFEPFYTTKAPGEGTGLGLALCERRVRRFGGQMGVESAPGGGARVVIALRVADAHDGARAREAAPGSRSS